MKNSQYIKTLEKALAGMDKQSRADILLEINSHVEELGDDNFSLLERFGSPEDLAKQYLEGATIAMPIKGRVSFWGKRLLLSIAAACIFVIVATVISIWYLSQDDFNFANEQATQLQIDNSNWNTTETFQPIELNIDQSQASIYWHSKNQVSWKCKGANPDMNPASTRLDIRHNNCLIFLPSKPVSISINQASVVIVRPQGNVALRMQQASLRIAENGAEYQYIISKDRSNIGQFKSSPSATVTVDIKAMESTIEHYQF